VVESSPAVCERERCGRSFDYGLRPSLRMNE